MRASEILLSEKRSDMVLLLRLNRPEKSNALATDLLAEIADALDAVAGDPEVRAAVITGSDKVFAAGADINELAQRDTDGALADPRPGLWARIRAFPKPLIAAVEGWSLGAGNELVMCCDLAVSGEKGKFGQPETNLGIIPGAGGTATLPRLVGRTRAMKMVLLGEPISAQEALAAGLICEVVEAGKALETALALAARIAARAPVAMQQGKAMVRAAFETPQTAHLAMERQAFSALFGTADKKEGVAAFLEKRDPEWSGR
ncbi:enoyl-CoA hydratase-related protein [Erythrobacter sp. EC-HK427]|uniref:enoyl-CoA hydratase-related protein n=1 Tax=Erythrobacter sp. EC-HK427 TaxID=2038396 RepID=UPI001251BA20|nr:enoyl-CoA hydratase-related protein [Erythrobacter sp. EC-HK427]VVT10550.1 enoyl-CoA hydratase-isomerase [Erythrobacter sp. EC-HK427]